MNLKKKFEKFGFVVLRNAFSNKECIELKKTILHYFTDDGGHLMKNTTKNYRDGKQCTAPMAFNNCELENLLVVFENKEYSYFSWF